MAADLIIVGKHTTRWATNDKVRALLGRTSPLPEVGDKVMCRHNNNKLGLLNGDIFKVTEFTDGRHRCRIGIENEDISMVVPAHKDYFSRKEPSPWAKKDAACLDWGFCTTCHAAQGGQAPFVFVKDESYCFRADRHRWLYTALSRAETKLVVRL